MEVVPSPPDELEEDPDGGNVTCADALDDDAGNSTATALNATLDLASMVRASEYFIGFVRKSFSRRTEQNRADINKIASYISNEVLLAAKE